MQRKFKLLLLLLASGLALLLLNYFNPKWDVITSLKPLPPGVDRLIVIDKNGVIDQDKKGARKHYVPDEGKTEIVQDDKGKLHITVKTKGFCFRPGFGGGFIAGNANLVADVKFVYWGRLGAVAGIPISHHNWTKPYIGCSYTLIRNTSGFVGLNTKKEIVAGLRVSF